MHSGTNCDVLAQPLPPTAEAATQCSPCDRHAVCRAEERDPERDGGHEGGSHDRRHPAKGRVDRRCWRRLHLGRLYSHPSALRGALLQVHTNAYQEVPHLRPGNQLLQVFRHIQGNLRFPAFNTRLDARYEYIDS